MKKVMSILGVLAAMSLLFSANAQENANRDENGKVVRGAYETNKAFDNIFIGISGGVNTVIPSITNFKTMGNLGVSAGLDFGKWFTPAVGIRAGWQGVWVTPKVTYDRQGGEPGQKYGSNFIHGDFMWNMFNTLGGYKETRVWNLIPYATAGLLMTSNKLLPFGKGAGINNEYAMGGGLYNTFRLGERVSLTLDLKALIGKAVAYTSEAGRFILLPSATAGLAFNLGKTNFDRHTSITPVVIPVPFTVEQYKDLEAKVAALESENAALKAKIAKLEDELAPFRNLVDGQTYLYQNGQFTAIEPKIATPATLYFDLGSAKLSQRELAHLEYFAQNAVDSDTELVVTGSADKQTGNARINQTLSEKRANYVRDLLVNKYGASSSNIEVVAEGDRNNIFDTPAKNRVVTIKVK